MFIIILILILILLIFVFLIHYLELNIFFSNKSLKNLDSKYRFKNRAKSNHKVVISLTTIPERINRIQPTIKSLLNQSVKVDEIRINIPTISSKGKKYIIPNWLKKLNSIKIVRCKKDYGPSTKLLPTLANEILKGNEKTRIIVVDDDVIYGSKLIEKLILFFETKNKSKNVAVTGFGAITGSPSTTISLKDLYLYFRYSGLKCKTVTGHHGYIITPEMLDHRVFDYSKAPREAFYVDDIWITGWLIKNKVKICMMGSKSKCFAYPNFKLENNSPSLLSKNKDNKNAKIVAKWFKLKSKTK